MSLAGRIFIALLGVAGGLTAAAGAVVWPDAVRSELQVGPAFFVFGALPASLLIGAVIVTDSRKSTTKESLVLAGGAATAGVLTLVGLEHAGVLAWAGLMALVIVTACVLRPRAAA